MSIPPTTPFTEAVRVRTLSCMRSSLASPLIACYLSLVRAPPHTVLLDMALLATRPTDGCLLLVWWCFAFALVWAVLGVRGGGGGCGSTGGWFITTLKAISRVGDWQG